MEYKVYIVGAGPGNPGLITARGLEILRQADVVIYDYLVGKTVLEEAKEDAELICCDRLAKKGRYSDGFLIHQERINNLIVKKAREGKRVVRLKNGCPSIFSRLSQELDALVKKKIEFEIVPGVTAASAASCSSGIPLTDRRFASSCVFVTGHEDPSKKKSAIDWDSLSKLDTMVIYMGIENLSKIVKELTCAGKKADTPIAIVQDASLATQKTIIGTLGNIVKKAKEENLKAPAIIIIGEVVKLARRFNWLKKARRILFTGLAKERFFTSGTYFHLPLIKIGPMEDYRDFDDHLKNLNPERSRRIDWIVFSSRYGVEYFFKRLRLAGYDSRILSGIRIAAIGSSTKDRLSDFGLNTDLVPKKESSIGLLEEFRKISLRGKRVFLPRSNISDKGLARGFERLGATVTTGFAYRNVMQPALPDLDLNNFSEIMFTSPSTVRSFKKRYKRIPASLKTSCIGDVTYREAARCRLLD